MNGTAPHCCQYEETYDRLLTDAKAANPNFKVVLCVGQSVSSAHVAILANPGELES